MKHRIPRLKKAVIKKTPLQAINYNAWIGKQSFNRKDLLPAQRKWKSVKIVKVARPKWWGVMGRWKPVYQVAKKVRK